MPEKFNLTEQQGRWLLLLPAILIIVLRFFEFFQTPNSRLIERWGDGLKNYTNVWYHVEHDSSYTTFEGMNYPYGDHLVMVDGQPLLANTLKWMDRNMLDVGDYTLGTIHFAMLLSVLGACAVFDFSPPPAAHPLRCSFGDHHHLSRASDEPDDFALRVGASHGLAGGALSAAAF